MKADIQSPIDVQDCVSSKKGFIGFYPCFYLPFGWKGFIEEALKFLVAKVRKSGFTQGWKDVVVEVLLVFES